MQAFNSLLYHLFALVCNNIKESRWPLTVFIRFHCFFSFFFFYLCLALLIMSIWVHCVKYRNFTKFSPETMRKLCLSTTFPYQEIRWKYGILRSDWQGFILVGTVYFGWCKDCYKLLVWFIWIFNTFIISNEISYNLDLLAFIRFIYS